MNESQENFTLVFPEQLNTPVAPPLNSEASQPVAERLPSNGEVALFMGSLVVFAVGLGLLIKNLPSKQKHNLPR